MAAIKKFISSPEVREAIRAMCEKHNYDPFEDLVKIATGTQVMEIDGKDVTFPLATVEQRITIATALAPYLAPKLKNTEVTGNIKTDWNITVNSFAGAESRKNMWADSPYIKEEDMRKAIEDSKSQALKDVGDIVDAEVAEEQAIPEPDFKGPIPQLPRNFP